MDSKKKIVIGVVVVLILVVALFIFKGGSSSLSDKNGWDTGSVTGLIFTNKMTDEIQIEMISEIDPGQGEEAVLKKADEILNKYGVTKEEYARYSEELYNDKARTDALMQKVVEKTLESMKTEGK